MLGWCCSAVWGCVLWWLCRCCRVCGSVTGPLFFWGGWDSADGMMIKMCVWNACLLAKMVELLLCRLLVSASYSLASHVPISDSIPLLFLYLLYLLPSLHLYHFFSSLLLPSHSHHAFHAQVLWETCGEGVVSATPISPDFLLVWSPLYVWLCVCVCLNFLSSVPSIYTLTLVLSLHSATVSCFTTLYLGAEYWAGSYLAGTALLYVSVCYRTIYN